MGVWDIAVAIAEIIILINKGMSKDEAVAQVSRKSGISASKLWGHGGF
ncbi:MAG: hypothetical protein NTW85_12655 [Methylococcales bacterium]|nr:hypothetical protein [Methylococcales bacterium]